MVDRILIADEMILQLLTILVVVNINHWKVYSVLFIVEKIDLFCSDYLY